MDIEKQLTDIDKKLSKILNLQTKIAKALHLIPITPKEEKELQVVQRKNAQVSAQIYDEIDKMVKIETEEPHNLFQTDFHTGDAYGDVVGSDFLDDYRKMEV